MVHRSMGGKGDRCHTMSLAEGFAHTARKRAPRVSATCGLAPIFSDYVLDNAPPPGYSLACSRSKKP
jgi:hypothetical protein